MHELNQMLATSELKVKKILAKQNSKKLDEGCFVYELEADSTIPSELILLMHYLGDIDVNLQKKIVKYLLSKQNKDGGWPLFYDGKSDVSASVKAYFALKLSGFDPNSKLMKKAKKYILSSGGGEKANVFTKISLAIFGQISWNAVPFMPIEIMKFPKWFPFNIYKISYWSRTVLVPLLIIMHKKPLANNPNSISINEVFLKPSHTLNKPKVTQNANFLSKLFLYVDQIARRTFPFFPNSMKKRCLEDANEWIIKRLNGDDGLGGIFPAMVNSLIALDLDEQKRFIKEVKTVKNAIKKLVIQKKDSAYCQPCVSPVWDSGWMGHVLLENNKNVDDLASWFLKKEIKKTGDWSINNEKLKPGGWAFQFNNESYPDVDDTALVGMFLDRYNRFKKNEKIEKCIERTRMWIISMQSKNGGWGAFDINNDHTYLNYIPFADHGALLDPPTTDVSARCISFLKQLNNPEDKKIIKKGLDYILSEQEKNGSWYGRWGTNYIYGTWSALSSLNLLEFPNKKIVINKAIEYLKSMQREDGGWGEDGKSYYENSRNHSKVSTPSQTAWAIMGLLASGQIDSLEVRKGVSYLLKKKNWTEDHYTAVGFPKVFYLKYHGYAKYFPLLAISKIKNQLRSNSLNTMYGV